MTNDINFLNKVIELHNLVYFNEPLLLIDIEGVILFAGNKIEDLIHIKVQELIGKNHLSILPLPQENIISINTSIKKVLITKITQEFLSINLNHSSEYLILSCVLKPIINPKNNNVVALSVESRKLNAPLYLYKLLLFIENNQLIKQQTIEHKDDLLTLREHEIAFLLFYCKSTKKIATILSGLYGKSITAKTVSNIISEKLYSKLGVYGMDALIDNLQALRYHNKIPVSFLTNIHLDLS